MLIRVDCMIREKNFEREQRFFVPVKVFNSLRHHRDRCDDAPRPLKRKSKISLKPSTLIKGQTSRDRWTFPENFNAGRDARMLMKWRYKDKSTVRKMEFWRCQTWILKNLAWDFTKHHMIVRFPIQTRTSEVQSTYLRSSPRRKGIRHGRRPDERYRVRLPTYLLSKSLVW